MHSLLFVYGTLKRGCQNHHHMAGQNFLGTAQTIAGYHLVDLGGYPAIVAKPGHLCGVIGEVWKVDEAALGRLDEFEGVHEGLYRRAPIPLLPPFADHPVDAYISVLPTTGRTDLGSKWLE